MMYIMLPAANIMLSFTQSTAPGKIIILILLIFSIYAWTIMVSKTLEMKRAERESRYFLTAYRKTSNKPLTLFLEERVFPDSPLYAIYENGCRMLSTVIDPEHSIRGARISDHESRQMEQLHMDALRNLNERNVADQALVLENNMGWLATAVSVSPFLGLLGTVWGVMEAFGGMAVTGSATLSSVAPGISSALLTTIIGLIVALPSAIGYNVLTNKIRRMCVELDNFAQEFSAHVQYTFYANR